MFEFDITGAITKEQTQLVSNTKPCETRLANLLYARPRAGVNSTAIVFKQ